MLNRLLVNLGLRRPNQWERLTLLDHLLASPLAWLTTILYNVIQFLRGSPLSPPRSRPPIRIVCISDTHEQLVAVPDGDLLIHAGDLTNSGTLDDVTRQLDWIESLPHRYKVVVCGNHDRWFDPRTRCPADAGARKKPHRSIHYLQHSMASLVFPGERRLRIYGAPDLPRCGDDATNA